MRLVFIDESGDPGDPTTSTSRHFVICAMIVHEKDWPFMQGGLAKIKMEAKVSPLAEVKWSHCMQPVNLTFCPRRPNPIAHLDAMRRERFALEVLNLVRRMQDCRLVACEIDKARAFTRSDITESTQIYNQATMLVMERVQYYLKATASRGLIIQDSRDYQQDTRLRSFYGSLIYKGSYWTRFPNVVEGVFLSPSDYSVGLQVVDFCAGAVAKNSNLSKTKDPKFFREIRNRFTHHKRDQVDRGGLKRWP